MVKSVRNWCKNLSTKICQSAESTMKTDITEVTMLQSRTTTPAAEQTLLSGSHKEASLISSFFILSAVKSEVGWYIEQRSSALPFIRMASWQIHSVRGEEVMWGATGTQSGSANANWPEVTGKLWPEQRENTPGVHTHTHTHSLQSLFQLAWCIKK